jgi:uncharacterized protein (TIGR03382 family)
MDAAEMTVDPVFVFNAELPQDATNQHTATNVLHCGFFEGFDHGERSLVLEDGREFRLPSTAWMQRRGETEAAYLAEVASPAALVIEDLGGNGLGEVLFDYREQASDDARQVGRGCDSNGVPTGAGALVALVALARRRR